MSNPMGKLKQAKEIPDMGKIVQAMLEPILNQGMIIKNHLQHISDHWAGWGLVMILAVPLSVVDAVVYLWYLP